MTDNLLALTEGLRAFYEPDNRIGLLLDELIRDLRDGAPRDEVIGDAQALRAELPAEVAAYKVIGRILEALGVSA